MVFFDILCAPLNAAHEALVRFSTDIASIGVIIISPTLRALQYRNKEHTRVDQDQVLHDEALDETGTIDTTALTDSDAESTG